MNKISYSITVCQERFEVQKLIEHIQKYKREEDDIFVLFDEKNGSNEVREYLETIENITLIRANFDNDFAMFKNKLFNYINRYHPDITHTFWIDADELPNQILIEYLPDIINDNPDVELFWIPRINTVDGIGLLDVRKWGWNISKLDNYVQEKQFDLSDKKDNDEYCLLKEYDLIIEGHIDDIPLIVKFYTPIINKWDMQGRICKNKSELRWKGVVHETIQGAATYSALPADENLSLYHHKQLSKQIKQNELYNNI